MAIYTISQGKRASEVEIIDLDKKNTKDGNIKVIVRRVLDEFVTDNVDVNTGLTSNKRNEITTALSALMSGDQNFSLGGDNENGCE